ncbi:MAG: hypothetical protein AMS27_05715 [Bacteroides sp. SM23_62_1]|nr:MAG: hypothetical protein AMS27_05715 [Bacteroides sp. SM23_62_1]
MLSFLVLSILFFQSARCQHYDFAAGVRIGLSYGINGKLFLKTNQAVQSRGAIEGIVSFRHKGIMGSLLYEYHFEVFDTEGMYLYCGGGMHAGMLNSDEVPWETDHTGKKPYAGLDGIIGLEYAFSDIPVSVGLDWKPGFNIISDFNLIIDDIALSVRITFG